MNDLDPSNTKTLFAATWPFAIYPWWAESGGPGSGIYVSRDGGSTWQQLSGRGLPASPLGRIALAISAAAPKRIYAAIETADPAQGTLWRSDDIGETWRCGTARELVARPALRADEPTDAARPGRRLHHRAVGGRRGIPNDADAPQESELGLALAAGRRVSSYVLRRGCRGNN
jgi:hypothetical protein